MKKPNLGLPTWLFSFLLCSLSVASRDPARSVFHFLSEGDFVRAEKILQKENFSLRSCKLLSALVFLEKGSYQKARELLKSFVRGGDPASDPLPQLLDAEAAIRLGEGSSVRASLHEVFSQYRLLKRVSAHALHLLVMQESWGQVPDEPCGLVPEADLGYSLALRLGLTPPEDQRQRKRDRRYLSYVRERLPHAPILTLSGGPGRPLDSSPKGYILVAFLSCDQKENLNLVRDSILPLAHRSEPGQRLYVCLILYSQLRESFKKAAALIRTYDSRGETLIIWTPRPDAFVAYGVTEPPFFLLIPRKYETGPCDWESPWGFPKAFLERVRRRIARGTSK